MLYKPQASPVHCYWKRWNTQSTRSRPVQSLSGLGQRLEALTRGTSKGMSDMGVPGHNRKWGVATRPPPAVRPKDSRWSSHTWRPGKIPTLPQRHMVMDNYKFKDTVTNSTYISTAPDHEQCLSRWPRQLARLSQATWWTSNSMFWTPVKLTQSQVSRQSEGETYFYKGSNYLNLISAGVLFFLNQYWIIVDGIYNIFNLSFSC